MDKQDSSKSDMENALERLPLEKHLEALKIAHKFKIHEDDAVWILVAIAIESEVSKQWSCKAAKSAGEAADRVRDEIQMIPAKIKEGLSGSDDLIREIVRQELFKILQVVK
jgi:hypothetical protein